MTKKMILALLTLKMCATQPELALQEKSGILVNEAEQVISTPTKNELRYMTQDKIDAVLAELNALPLLLRLSRMPFIVRLQALRYQVRTNTVREEEAIQLIDDLKKALPNRAVVTKLHHILLKLLAPHTQ
ncbi:hypothetical protein CVU75_01480 [Candidatus Dependentiae bacterium HGW-Dependentiae-1]|nr:MAG: hypothetical protein CVU75_01480 [Candidatus Dependentiae bacterium HGW-Dependentiae-1]